MARASRHSGPKPASGAMPASAAHSGVGKAARDPYIRAAARPKAPLGETTNGRDQGTGERDAGRAGQAHGAEHRRGLRHLRPDLEDLPGGTAAGGGVHAGRSPEHLADLRRALPDDVGQPQAGRRRDDRVLGGAAEALAELDAEVARVEGSRRGPAAAAHDEGGQALRPQGVERERAFRVPEAVLSPHLGLHPGHGRHRRRDGPEGAAEGRLLHPAVRRGDEPGQLLRPQPRGARGHRRAEGREPRPRPQDDARRHRARQGQAPDSPDRHGRLRGRPQHRGLSGRGRLPERPHPAHPVRAGDREGLRQAAPHHPALDQQVLHPRPQPEEEHGEVAGRAGPHRLRRLLGEPRPAPRGEDLGGLHVRGRPRRHRQGAGGDRAEEHAPRQLLRRRHAWAAR